jgi:hypothetical protein
MTITRFALAVVYVLSIVVVYLDLNFWRLG